LIEVYAMGDQQKGYRGVNRFDQVDATGEAGKHLEYLDRVEAIPGVVARRRRSYDRLELRPGMTVADIGCGAGMAARELAIMVGPEGRVLGFDISEQLIAHARARVAAAEFQVADAVALPLADASLDGYRAERVFMHLRRPELALAEAFRVLRPGGRILIMDHDWDTLLFDGDLAATRTVTRAFTDSLVNGTIARRMRPLLWLAGFNSIEIFAEPVIATDSSDYGWMADSVGKAALAAGADRATVDAWMDDQRRRIAEDCFLYASTHFLTTARHP
jgi:ubiquinone/menaquinone biosynthesis C-methylase UbiE